MSAYTLADAIQFCKDKSGLDGSVRSLREYTRFANDALGLLRTSRLFEADLKHASIKFVAPYSTGTVAVNGTAITGTDTVFTPAMLRRTMYINSELYGYDLVARAGNTAVTLGEAYKGDLGTGGGNPFELVMERGQLPLDFRELYRPDNGSLLYTMHGRKDLAELESWRRMLSYRGIPQYYAVEWLADLNSPNDRQPWLRVYPAPQTDMIIDFVYSSCPTALVNAGDSFGLPATAGVSSVIELYLQAALLMRAGDVGAYQSMKGLAESEASRVAGSLRPIADDSPGRRPYREGFGRTRFMPRYAPGSVTNP